MIFNSLVFAYYLAAFLALYWLFRNQHQRQNLLIVVGSAVFYGWWDWRFLFLLSVTIGTDYVVGRRIHESHDRTARKQLMLISIVVNLTILGFFKYYNFFVDGFEQLLSGFGMEIDSPALNIILPVGISFYTFQSMSYVIDVYNRRIDSTERLVDYAAYVSFFPQLVAGPIERATQLLPQIVLPRRMTHEGFCEGSYLIFWGLFKKIFIADNLARLVDPVYGADSATVTGEQVVFATYAFAFQIYCDFSAYSDIARGIGKILGVEIMLNFNLPYFSQNPSEFWRRWHISLSTWLRDYLYIGLGGNRDGNLKTYRNLMLTMVLGGLWHGAQMNFVLWGIYQGTLLLIHRWLCTFRFMQVSFSNPGVARVVRWCTIFAFFQLVCLGWLLFRAESGQQILDFLSALGRGVDLYALVTMSPKLVFYCLPLIAVQVLQYSTGNLNVIYDSPVWLRIPVYCGLFFTMLVFGVTSGSDFIYFQF